MIEPIFFDHFGFLIWIFLIWISVIDLNDKTSLKWPKWILFFIGVLGVLIDGLLLEGFYLGWAIIDFAWVYDYLGIPVFLFIIFVAFKDFRDSKISRPYWTKWLALIIGVGGFLADGFILLSHYFGL